jgi:GMP synthase (glutamine-hydrolysing)
VLTDTAAAWARHSVADLDAIGLTVTGISAEIEAGEPELRRVWGEFAARWMRVVTSGMPSGRS